MRSIAAGLLFPLLVGVMAAVDARTARPDGPLVFVSSFAAGSDGAIHAFRLDSSAGRLTSLHRNGGVEHPFFIAVSPDRRFLYSIHAKQFSGKEDEHVAAFEIDGSRGELKPLNRQSSRGTASCYLEVDATGRSVLLANYTSGSVAAYPVRKDGSLGEAASFFKQSGASVNPDRQQEPHAHSFVVSPNNRYAYAADLGLDQILCYRLEASGARLTSNRQPFVRTPPGAGPRHLTFHPNGRYLYAINELANSVTLFDWDSKTGVLIERQTLSTLPADFKGVSHCADLKITPDGRFLYGTNRGHDSIAAYRIGEGGGLSPLGIVPSRGKGPQNLAITPAGDLLLCANMPGDNVAVFRIDSGSGRLSPLGEPVPVKSPSCIRIVP